MVELPRHDRKSNWFSRWLKRDLNESRPYSLLLCVIPVLPAILAEKLGASETVTAALFWIGGPLAIGWLIYILFRRFSIATRDIKRSFSDMQARKRGKEFPTRCPECGADLPAFAPPNDGHVYDFAGWDCENCGAVLDELGHRI